VAAVRFLPYLGPGGVVIVSRQAIVPVTAAVSGCGYDGGEMLAYLHARVERVIVVDGEAVCAACGSAKVLNVALLGAAAAAGVLGASLEGLESTIATLLPKKFVAMNRQALRAGASYV
jgi:indolepyruvate ferredoxin oxidoreductase, beta subunit